MAGLEGFEKSVWDLVYDPYKKWAFSWGFV